MADRLLVDRAALATSAIRIQGHGDDLAVSHTATERRVIAVLDSWVGQSAQALDSWTADLASTSNALVNRIGHHCEHMRSSSSAHGANDESRARDIRALG